VAAALRGIKPEVLIEFRQSYVGPAIRKYGNMLRVCDCPNDALINRQDIINLRLTSGSTAVHSDMLMWHPDDPVENAALQMVSVLYGVPQISVKLETLPEAHRKMLAFYLSFWSAHRDTLIDGMLYAENPESAYSIVYAEKSGRAIFTCYTDTRIDCGSYSEVIAVNASRHSTLLLKGADGKQYKVLDCMGNTIEAGAVNAALCEIEVPLSGMVCVK
jgi:alpha-galactosidase